MSHSAATKEKMRAAAIKRWSLPSERLMQAVRSTGRAQPPEARAKIAEARRGKKMSAESSEKKRAFMRMRPVSALSRATTAENNRARVWTPESRARLSASQKARVARPEIAPIQSANARRGREKLCKMNGPSKIEAILADELAARGVQHMLEHPIGPYCADAYVPSMALVIEADGEKWHSSQRAKIHDARRDGYMMAQGYRVLRIPGRDFINGRFRTALTMAGV